MRLINLRQLTGYDLNEPEAQGGSEARLVPENHLDKLALKAFCIETQGEIVWKSRGMDDSELSIYLKSLQFNDDGFATLLEQPKPKVFDFDYEQHSVTITFWVELVSGQPTGCWRATGELFKGEQKNWLGYPIVF